MADRPTILVFIKGLGIGGAEKLISEGARFWDRDRFDYRVAYQLPWKDQLVPDLEALGVPVTCVGGRKGITPAAVVGLRRAHPIQRSFAGACPPSFGGGDRPPGLAGPGGRTPNTTWRLPIGNRPGPRTD